MSKKGFFHSLRNIFASEREDTTTIKEAEEELFTRREDDIPAKRFTSKPILPTDDKPKVFLKFTDMRKPMKGLDIKFVRNFSGKSGRFIFCESHDELIQKLNEFAEKQGFGKICIWEDYTKNWLEEKGFDKKWVQKNFDGSEAAISLCEGLIAEEGSLMFTAEQATRRTLNVFPPIHIVIAHSKQFKEDIEHGLEEYKFRYDDELPFIFQLGEDVKKYRFINNKPLINAEGTKDVYVFFTDEPIVFE